MDGNLVLCENPQDSRVRAVLPYEPYYKLKSSVLSWVLAASLAKDQLQSESDAAMEPRQQRELNVLLFPGTPRESTQ